MIEMKIISLYEAVEKNLDIELKPAEKSREECRYLSRFIQYSLGQKIILIDIPKIYPGSPAIKPLEKNDSIVVRFFFNDTPFFFNSNVVGFTGIEFPNEPKKTVMAIALPETLFGQERRDFFKVRTPHLAVEIKVIESADIAKQWRGKTLKASAVNISAGGIALERLGKELPFTPGDILALLIHLPNELIPIEGKVVNIYQLENSDKLRFGIRFIQHKLDKLSFNKNINSIVKYVMKRERELLPK